MNCYFSAVFYYGMCTWMAESRNHYHRKKGTELNGRSKQQYQMLIVNRFENNWPHPATSANKAAAIDEFAIEKFLPFFSGEAQHATRDSRRGAGSGHGVWFDAPCSGAANNGVWLERTWCSLNEALVKRDVVSYVSILNSRRQSNALYCRV